MLSLFQSITTLLKTLSVVAGEFDDANKTYTKAGANFDQYFAAGDKVLISGSVLNPGEKTVAAAGANDITFEEAIVDEIHDAVLARVFYTSWYWPELYPKVSAIINASQNLTMAIQQSADAVTVDYTTTVNVVGGTPSANLIDVICPAMRIKLTNGATSQTTLRCFLYGRSN